ncbi:MAG: hypothetical protein A2W19_07015 [Spirochaetes bacterium RBG_16_49_21]|nr:MAG: hypothetical protein A2W19_07015 [Spirochaetes bacterium RBG_16_49_21]
MNVQQAAVCVALVCVIAFAECRFAPPRRQAIAAGDFTAAAHYLDSLIRTLMKEHRIPGIAVAVVHGGRVLFSRCYGSAHAEKNIPLTDETAFMAGSLTKSFTALAVTRLIGQGKVAAGADIRTYIPEFSIRSYGAPAKPITVRHLLTHTSGLMIDYYPRFTGEKQYGDRELLSLLKNEYLCSPPGTAVKYSNIGYKLLGMMVERVTGEPFERHMMRVVLAPVGMKGSYYGSAGGKGNEAAGHDGDRGNKVMPLLDIGDSASSGLFTTLKDLAAFLRFLSVERKRTGLPISGPEAVASVLRNADRSIDTFYDNTNVYSTGWYLDFYRFRGTGNVMSNSGNVNGFSSELAYMPEAKLGMAVLSNSSVGWKADIEITARGLRAFLDAAHGPMTGGEDGDEKKEPARVPPPADLTGRYAAFGIMVDVFSKKDSLYARFKGPAAQLVPQGKGVYAGKVCILFVCFDVSRFTEFDAVRFRFYANRAGKAFLSMEASYGESFFSFPLHRVNKPSAPEAFRRYYGIWELPEDTGYPGVLKLYLPSNRFRVFEKEGWPIMETETWMGKGLLVLEPLSDGLARIAGSGEIISFTDNELRFIGLRFRRKK